MEKVARSWNDLVAWQNVLLRQLPGVEGVNSIGIRNSLNKIVVQVANDRASEAVRAMATEVNVPVEAIEFVEGGPPQGNSGPLTGAPLRSIVEDSLRGYQRPLVGGIITARPGDGPGKGCTIGFIARRNGVDGFVTVSHCTAEPAAVDGELFFQHLYSGTYFVGHETVDPPTYNCNSWPWHPECRKSDASFVEVTAGVDVSRGYIARPTQLHSRKIDPVNPTFKIIDAYYGPTEGQTVYMVGQRSGLVQGEVTDECRQNLRMAGTSIRLRCQFVATYNSGPGDSGAPVFYWPNQGTSQVALVGIHWGNDMINGGVWLPDNESYGSGIDWIIHEMGSMSIVAPNQLPPGGGTPPGGCTDPNTGDPIPC